MALLGGMVIMCSSRASVEAAPEVRRIGFMVTRFARVPRSAGHDRRL
jgi:hypothetical protein